jgi:DNA-binding CsgD family transcriptional regulator
VTSQLVERDRVLDALSDHLGSAVRGCGRVVLLHGEAGVGKTAVLRAFADQVGDTTEVLWGWCEPLSTPRPLGPVLDVAPGLGSEVRTQVEHGPGGVAEVCRAMMDALRAASKVLVFEDVHWADAATLDLISMLARRIEQVPALLTVSYRDDEIGPAHAIRSMLGYLAGLRAVHRYAIEPLTRDGVARLARDRIPIDDLYRVTGGNPFFVTEVLAAGGKGIPDTVADSVAGRLARVSPAARRTAEAVSVIGSPAALHLVHAVVNGTDNGVGELLEAGVLIALDAGVGFRHDLARMAVLDALPTFERVGLHARVLQALRADPGAADDAALLAHHADAAGDGDAVMRYAPAAAERAAALGAHREAAAQYERALRFPGSLPPARQAELLEGLAHARMHTGFTGAVQAMEQALELRRDLGDTLHECNDLRWLSGLFMPMGRCAEAWEAGRRAVRKLETLPPLRELAWAHLNLCQLSAYDQRGTLIAEYHARRAVALGERMGDREVVWQAHFHVAAAQYACGEGGQADPWADMERIRLGAREAGLEDSALFFAMQAAWLAAPQRDHDRVAAMARELEGVAGDRDVQTYLLCTRGYQTLGLLHTGAWEEATELATSVLDHPASPPVTRLLPLTILGLIRARRGDPDGLALLDQARNSFERSGWTLLVDAARAEAAWLASDPRRACAETTCGLAAVTPHTSPWCAGEVARWARVIGTAPPSVRVAEPFALEIAGDWQTAAKEWDQRDCAYDAALARLGGDLPALLTALETFESLGARPAALITRNRLRELGHRIGSRGPRATTRSNRHGLTTRQVEIIELVAEGLTGPQIAARLHLSPKTVDHHVNAAMIKLGAHSRTEAARLLTE